MVLALHFALIRVYTFKFTVTKNKNLQGGNRLCINPDESKMYCRERLILANIFVLLNMINGVLLVAIITRILKVTSLAK